MSARSIRWEIAHRAEVQLRLASSRPVLLERLLKPRLLRFVLVSQGNVNVKLLDSSRRGDHRQHVRLGKAEPGVAGDDIVLRDDTPEKARSQIVRAPPARKLQQVEVSRSGRPRYPPCSGLQEYRHPWRPPSATSSYRRFQTWPRCWRGSSTTYPRKRRQARDPRRQFLTRSGARSRPSHGAG